MYLRTLIILIILAGGVLPSYAFNEGRNLQDSVKRITITITASEKPKVLDFDSLINNSQTQAPVEEPRIQVSNKPIDKGSLNKSSFKQTRKTDKPANKTTANSLPKKTKNQLVDQKPEPSTIITENHHDEIEEVQNIDDTTITDDSDIKTSRTFLWVGFMLIVVGVILGILFGKTALLISIAGIIFVIIGYLINR